MEVLKLATRDTDTAVSALAPFFPGLRVSADTDTPLTYVGDGQSIPGLSVFDITIGARVARGVATSPGFSVFDAQLVGKLAMGRDPIDASAPFLAPDQLAAEFTRIHARIARVDTEVMQRFVRTDLNSDSFELRPLRLSPVSAEAGGFWLSSANYVHGRLRDGSADNPLLGATLVQLLVTAYLNTFATNWSELRDQRDGAKPVTAAVRRARDFLDEHAGEPITITDVAAVARLSMRGLQEAFRRELGTTPMRYLRRVRLAAVHEALQLADPASASVGAVALHWGFANPSRFAAAYRAEFGEYPAQTLVR